MEEQAKPYTFFAALVAALGAFSFGFQTAVISGVLPFATQEFLLVNTKQGFLVSSILMGAIIGVFLCGYMSDTFGRKRSLQLQALLFIAGTIICFTSSSFFVLVMGRVISGLALGLASALVPLYLSEISPASCRGRMVAINQLFLSLGVLAAYTVNYLLTDMGSWRGMIAAGLAPCLLQLILLFFIEESPFWLLSKGCKQRAINVFQRLRGDTLWLESIDQVQGVNPAKKQVSFLKVIQNKKILLVIILGVVLNMFQQITGINAVLFYSPKIFSSMGFSSLKDTIEASIGIGIINLAFTIVAALIIDKAGRRKLLIASLCGMFFFLQLMIVSLYFFSSKGSVISLSCILGYVGFFAIGLGPVCFILISEMYPLAIRGRAMSIAVLSNWSFNYLVSFSFPLLVDLISVTGVFQLFAVLIIVALFFVYRFLPETKGKSLTQIESELQ